MRYVLLVHSWGKHSLHEHPVFLLLAAHRLHLKRARNAPHLLFFVQFEGAMELLEKSVADTTPVRGTVDKAAASAIVPTRVLSAAATASAPPRESIAAEESLVARCAEAEEELDVSPAAAAKVLQAGTSVRAGGGGEGEAQENGADGKDGSGGGDGDSGGVVYVPAPSRLPTPP